MLLVDDWFKDLLFRGQVFDTLVKYNNYRLIIKSTYQVISPTVGIHKPMFTCLFF